MGENYQISAHRTEIGSLDMLCADRRTHMIMLLYFTDICSWPIIRCKFIAVSPDTNDELLARFMW